MALCDRLITLSRERSQQDRRAPSTPPLFGSGPTDGLQLAQFLSAELQGVPLPWEGHASLKHNPVKMYSYLENDDLVTGAGVLTYALLSRVGRETAGPAIAVLPFVDMSVAKDQEYFSAGQTEELI